MEEEAREILASALTVEAKQTVGIGTAIRRRFAPLGGVDLPEIKRGPMRPVDLD
jgi:plasmid stability protein